MIAEGAAPNPSPSKLAWITGLAALHALLFMVSMSPLDFWPAALLAVAPLVWLAKRAASTRQAIGAVFVTQFVLWLFFGRWLINVTVVGYPLYAAYLSVYAVLFVWIVRRCLCVAPLAGWVWTPFIAIIWVGLETVKGKIAFSGYPWYLLGHPLNEWSPLAQSADIWGAYGVSFLAVLVAGVLVDGWRLRRGELPRRAWWTVVVVVLSMHVANLGYGFWRLGQSVQYSSGPRVLVIQTNVPQDNKIGWTPEDQQRDFLSFQRLTREAMATLDAPPDLIVWPETMLPGFGLEPQAIEFLIQNDYGPRDYFSRGIVDLRDELGVPVLVGSPVYVNLRVEGQRYAWDENYNAAYLIQGDAPFPRYDKYLLTPFGEVMPYVSAWPWLEQKLLSIGAQGMTFSLDRSETIRPT